MLTNTLTSQFMRKHYILKESNIKQQTFIQTLDKNSITYFLKKI